MINFIRDIITGNQINQSDLRDFLLEYIDLKGVKRPTEDVLIDLMYTVLSGRLSLGYAIKKYCEIKGYSVITIADLNGMILSIDVKNTNL
jgi:hypothetical protein